MKTLLSAIFPPLGAFFLAVKGLFMGIKGVMWLVLGILIMFLVLSRSCHHVAPIEVLPTPDATPTVLPKVLDNQDQTIHQDQTEATQTDQKVENTKEKIHNKVKVINSNKTLTETQRAQQIGQVQIQAMNDTYNEYFGVPKTTDPTPDPQPDNPTSTTSPPSTSSVPGSTMVSLDIPETPVVTIT